jgi:hypothetical protein
MKANLNHAHASNADRTAPQAPATPRPETARPGTARPGTARLRAGLGIAALIGAIATSGVTVNLGTSINAAATPSDTTCCVQSRMA